MGGAIFLGLEYSMFNPGATFKLTVTLKTDWG